MALGSMRERLPRRRSAEETTVASIEGWLSPGETRRLMKLAVRVPAGQKIVEIGSYRGRSSVALALGSRRGAGNRVYAVDPHDDYTSISGAQFGPADQVALYANLTRAGVGDLVSVVSLPSVAAARAWKERDIGLLWIDGGHSYEQATTDLVAWASFVVTGGVVAYHDSSWKSIREAIDDAIARRQLRKRGKVDSLTWCEFLR